jgi:hypothetical protein
MQLAAQGRPIQIILNRALNNGGLTITFVPKTVKFFHGVRLLLRQNTLTLEPEAPLGRNEPRFTTPPPSEDRTNQAAAVTHLCDTTILGRQHAHQLASCRHREEPHKVRQSISHVNFRDI